MSTGSIPGELYGPLYGSLYFSAVLSTAFYGITCMQTFFYYIHYQNDPLRMKIFIAALWVLDTIHETLVVSGAWRYILTGLTNPSLFRNVPPEIIIQLLFTTPVAVSTQGFFIYRIYIFSNKNIVVPLIWVIPAIIQLAVAFIYLGKSLYSANGIQVVEYTVLSDHMFSSLITSILSVAAGIDVVIAIFLTYLLVRTRIAAGFSSTAQILQRLTVFAVNTGIWTALFALLTIITLHVFPSYAIYAVFSMPLCSIYCNTLLANLNARAYVRGETLTHNLDADLFASSILPAFDGTETEEQSGEAKMVPSAVQGIWKTTEVVAFPDANRSTTAENTCA